MTRSLPASMFLLAIVVDVVINLAGRLATPWEHAAGARRRRQVAPWITAWSDEFRS